MWSSSSLKVASRFSPLLDAGIEMSSDAKATAEPMATTMVFKTNATTQNSRNSSSAQTPVMELHSVASLYQKHVKKSIPMTKM
mmetsp:Transcript_7956/g.17678  ORF Transcript_7956/g.17678 Transcript_7956/m.17678 type:complete len:83 (-) Transcript_7956:753-1001(-)